MHRFFIPQEGFSSSRVLIQGDQAHQITRVLRMAVGDQVIVLDNRGYEYLTQIEEISGNQIKGSIIEINQNTTEPFVDVTLFVSPLKRENFELILQKCTEIGVKRFCPTICDHTVLIPANWETRVDRWSRIIIEAAEQSHRGIIPVLLPPMTFRDAVSASLRNHYVFIASEKEQTNYLVDFLGSIISTNPPKIAIFIGPEGGFSKEEFLLADSCHMIPITLGKRILRAETAAIAASTLILNAVGKELR